MRLPYLRSWRTALRIARREMRAAKGRSALVIAMIAVPVGALSATAVSYDMFTLTPAEQATRQLGSADAILTVHGTDPIVQNVAGDIWRPAKPVNGGVNGRGNVTKADVLAVLDDGSRAVPVYSPDAEFRTATDGLASVAVHEMDLTDPVYRGMVKLLNGRAPSGPGEVAVSETARARFGNTIRSGDGARTYTTVGTVEFPANLGPVMVVAPGALARKAADAPAGEGTQWLVSTPKPLDWGQVGRINQSGIAVTSRAVLLDPAGAAPNVLPPDKDTKDLSLVPVVAGLAALETILLAGSAFAVGARRRRRSLALVAANGGTRAHLRRIVLADGLTLGFVAAAAGVVVGPGLAVAVRPFVEETLVGARAGGYRFDPPLLAAIVLLALATGLAAAAVPAFTAARADLIVALAGRRGVVRSKRRWLIAGLILAAVGVAIVAVAAQQTSTELIVVGLAVTESGLVLCTPSLVGLVAALGGRLPAAPRIALRDTARNRAASAPAVSAVMAAVAGTVAIGVYLSSSAAQHELNYHPSLPRGYLSIDYGDSPQPGTAAKARDALNRVLPGAVLTEITQTACLSGPPQNSGDCQLIPVRSPAQRCPGEDNPPTNQSEIDALDADPRCANEHATQGFGYTPFNSVIGGRDTVVALTGATGADLDRAAAILDRGGVVVSDPFLLDHGLVTVSIADSGPKAREIKVPGYLLRAGPYAQGTVMSPALARRVGFRVTAVGLVAATSEPDTETIDRLHAALSAAGLGPAYVESGPRRDDAPVPYLLAAASMLITLGAAGSATGLAAADGRADLSVLAAIGAAPRMRRLLSLSQAGVIAGLGSLLGVFAGVLSGWAVLTAVDMSRSTTWPSPTPYPLAVPWTNLLFVAATPVVAMLGAGLLTRSRLPIERHQPV
ncbi:MAG: putative transport system permease protein [Actinoplanes sp.]|jgi:putative ABC transport system permease protein|nr:putative transport system permease protein [Actinoplanes sp.]